MYSFRKKKLFVQVEIVFICFHFGFALTKSNKIVFFSKCYFLNGTSMIDL